MCYRMLLDRMPLVRCKVRKVRESTLKFVDTVATTTTSLPLPQGSTSSSINPSASTSFTFMSASPSSVPLPSAPSPFHNTSRTARSPSRSSNSRCKRSATCSLLPSTEICGLCWACAARFALSAFVDSSETRAGSEINGASGWRIYCLPSPELTVEISYGLTRRKMTDLRSIYISHSLGTSNSIVRP